MEKDRIRLAEAMGWEQTDAAGVGSVWRSPDNEVMPLPDPFTDANDDYAVLEWMRRRRDRCRAVAGDPDWEAWLYFSAIISNGVNYKVGDYARAALKVLDDG